MKKVAFTAALLAVVSCGDADTKSDLDRSSSSSRAMTSEEQVSLRRLQDVWRGTCGSRGYDSSSQECAYYVTQKTIEWRKAAGVW